MIGELDKGVLPAGATGTCVLDRAQAMPVCVLLESALEHNSAHMRSFIEQAGVELYPHGKTTMAPALWQRQLDDGCSGITVATFHQLRVARAHGIPRVIYANELIGAAEIEWVRDELKRDPDWQLTILADSVEGARLLEGVPVDVLLEVGMPGMRCGVRDVMAALRVAECVTSLDGPRLVGVEGFEGIVMPCDDRDDALRTFLDGFVEVAAELDRLGYFARLDEVILTAGGTAYYEESAAALRGLSLSRPTKVIVRSGCYLTHDTGLYDRLAPEGYRPSLEVWAQVLSTPEPELIIASAGRRDFGEDAGPPKVVKHLANSSSEKRGLTPFAAATKQGLAPNSRVTVTRVSDQHVHISVPAGHGVVVGDLVALSPSHPCTTFDKWRVIHVVDDDYRVVESVETYF